MQQVAIVGPAGGMAGHGERAHRHAVVADGPAQHVGLAGLAAVAPVLLGGAQRQFGGLGPAIDEKRVAHASRRQLCQRGRQGFRGRAGEMRTIGKAHAFGLVMHRIQHRPHAMADRYGHGAARTIQIVAAVGVVDVDAFGPVDHRQRRTQRLFQQHIYFRVIEYVFSCGHIFLLPPH
ncbi:hypothetical protein D9M68_571800 [compost metagenome]